MSVVEVVQAVALRLDVNPPKCCKCCSVALGQSGAITSLTHTLTS